MKSCAGTRQWLRCSLFVVLVGLVHHASAFSPTAETDNREFSLSLVRKRAQTSEVMHEDLQCSTGRCRNRCLACVHIAQNGTVSPCLHPCLPIRCSTCPAKPLDDPAPTHLCSPAPPAAAACGIAWSHRWLMLVLARALAPPPAVLSPRLERQMVMVDALSSLYGLKSGRG
jgi:hypothetical protein